MDDCFLAPANPARLQAARAVEAVLALHPAQAEERQHAVVVIEFADIGAARLVLLILVPGVPALLYRLPLCGERIVLPGGRQQG